MDSHLVEASYKGFLQPIIVNLMLFFFSVGKLMGCNSLSIWGIFWYNDEGAMFEKCLNTGFVGAKPSWYENN